MCSGALALAPAAHASSRGPNPLTLLARLHRAAPAAPRQPARPRWSTPDRDGPHPVTYYVDAMRGRNSNSGAGPAEPWRTLARVDQGRYQAGDAIRLRAGQRFTGTLRLTPANLSHTAGDAPLTVSSYGRGQATIAAGAGGGVVARNVSGVHIYGLRLVGRTRACQGTNDGILFDARAVNGTLDAGIAIDHVEAAGFCDGIVIGSEDDASRIAHVRIASSRVHDNRDAGIITYDPALRQHDIRDVRITDVRAFRNDDQGGVVLFGVEGGDVERSVTYANGRTASGSVGIWAFDADRIVIAHDESYGNLTTGDDGDGFDLDGGVSNSVLEYDYSHDNAGIGLLVCACVTWWYPQQNDVVRFNVSVNDGSSSQTSGIYVGGGQRFTGIDVYNNTAYSVAGSGPLVQINGGGAGFSHMHLWNNLLVAGAGKPLLEADPGGGRDVKLQGNDWWSAGHRFGIRWRGRRFVSLSAWRKATGAEMLAGRPVGLSAAPRVIRLGGGAYRPRGGSPLLGAGLDLRKLFGVEVGELSFSGPRAALNIGAE